MNWGQQIDKCSNGFCHLKDFFPFDFKHQSISINKRNIKQQNQISKNKFVNDDNYVLKLANKKSLKKFENLGDSKISSPTNQINQSNQTNKYLFKYQSPKKNQIIKNIEIKVKRNINQEFLLREKRYEKISEDKNEILFYKKNQIKFDFRTNNIKNRQQTTNQQNISVKKDNIRPSTSYIQQSCVTSIPNKIPSNNMTQFKHLNPPLLIIRPAKIINHDQYNDLRLARSNSPKIVSPTLRYDRPNSPQPYQYNRNIKIFFNNQKDIQTKGFQYKQSYQNNSYINIQNHKNFEKKKSQITTKSIENEIDSYNYQESDNNSHKQLIVNNEQFWSDQKCNFNKKKTVSVLELIQPLNNFEAIQEQNQINEESRFIKGTFNQQKSNSKIIFQMGNFQIIQDNKLKNLNYSNGFKMRPSQKRQVEQKQKSRKVFFAQVKQTPLYMSEAQSFSSFLESNNRNKNLNEQSIVGTQILESISPRQNQFQVSCEDSIILKKQINMQYEQINAVNAQFISQTALLTESKPIKIQKQLKNIERRQFHQPSIALKLFENQFRNSQKVNTIYLSESQNISSEYPQFQKHLRFKEDQKQNRLNKPLCRIEKFQIKGIIKNYEGYGQNKIQRLNFSPINDSKKTMLDNVTSFKQNQPNLKVRAFTQPNQKIHQNNVQVYKMNEHNRIQTFNPKQRTINSLFDDDQYGKIYPVSRTDFFVSKNAIDQSSNTIINSPRNMNKHDESTVIGRHCFSKPLFRLL